MTYLREQEHNAPVMDKKSGSEQMPQIGIFWFDLNDQSFFGVQKSEVTPKMVEEAADKGLPFINCPLLHRLVWAKEFFTAHTKHQDTKFQGDYTKVPRGRVAWNINKFIVLVGQWAEPVQDALSVLIQKEFNLSNFEFVYDEHWNLGHEWS